LYHGHECLLPFFDVHVGDNTTLCLRFRAVPAPIWEVVLHSAEVEFAIVFSQRLPI
jgi:hypothetical protein